MADYRAVASTCEAVLHLLRTSYDPADFNNTELEFKVFLASDFSSPIDAGVSLFLYRIYPNGHQRTPSGHLGPDGRRYRSQLPLDLHVLLTVWGKDASLTHTIAGWMMRVMEDSPVLPAALLNAVVPGVFRPEETVELSIGELSNEDILRMWEALAQDVYQLSIPYILRGVRIESAVPLGVGAPVQERVFDYRKAGGGTP